MIPDELVEVLLPEVPMYRKMTDVQASRILHLEEHTEVFAYNKRLAEKYPGTLYRCHVERPNRLLVLKRAGVEFLVELILKDLEDGSPTRDELVGAIVLIFRLIVATGCMLFDKDYHTRLFERLGLDERYEVLKPNEVGNPKELYRFLMSKLQASEKETEIERRMPCPRNTIYEVDIPLIAHYRNYPYSLPTYLKRLDLDGALFMGFYLEVAIMVGPRNPVRIEPVGPKRKVVEEETGAYRPPQRRAALPPPAVLRGSRGRKW